MPLPHAQGPRSWLQKTVALAGMSLSLDSAQGSPGAARQGPLFSVAGAHVAPFLNQASATACMQGYVLSEAL